MRLAFALLTLMGLAGCTLPAPTMAIRPIIYHDVAHYDSHPIERDQTLAWCSNNPGLIAQVPSCDSAIRSRRNAFNRRMGFSS